MCLTVPSKKAPANSVPAAAVIRGVQALSGITGRKGRVGGMDKSEVKAIGLTGGTAFETVILEYGRGKWNSWCSGEMRRYQEEHR